MKTLLEILSLKRPHGGAGELFVAENILARLPYELMVFKDKSGHPMAYLVEVASTTVPESRTVFVAHLDTVHREDGPNPVIYDESIGWMSKEDGTPLGADDGAGVWLLYKMIEASVPGTYLFTVGEERGGVGAKWMAANAEEFLSKFDRAIEFDRRGTTSVITHQGFGRCCSDEFAEALAGKLGMGFKPDDTGVYTDTAEFTDVISECTNISCGYNREHSGMETLDTIFLQALLCNCVSLDWESLPVARDPSVVDTLGYEGAWWSKPKADTVTVDDLYLMTTEERVNLCYDDPEAVACLLTELMYNDVTYGRC